MFLHAASDLKFYMGVLWPKPTLVVNVRIGLLQFQFLRDTLIDIHIRGVNFFSNGPSGPSGPGYIE